MLNVGGDIAKRCGINDRVEEVSKIGGWAHLDLGDLSQSELLDLGPD